MDGDRKLRVFESDTNQRQNSRHKQVDKVKNRTNEKSQPKEEKKEMPVPSECFVCREVLKQVVSRESTLAAGREARGTVP